MTEDRVTSAKLNINTDTQNAQKNAAALFLLRDESTMLWLYEKKANDLKSLDCYFIHVYWLSHLLT